MRTPAGPAETQNELNPQLTNNQLFEHLCEICSGRANRRSIEDFTAVDWRSLWSLSLRHKIGPVVTHALRDMEVEIHPSISADVLKYNRQNLMKAMQHSAELVRLTKIFHENDIRILAFKGLALLGVMGLDLSRRQCGDIDLLLVDPGDIQRADELLKAAGFEQSSGIANSDLSNQWIFKFFPAKDLSYSHKRKNIQIELHFSLFHVDLISHSNERLFNNKSDIKMGADVVPAMSLDDHLLYLLLHGSFSCWHRLKWLVDLPLISNNGIDYRQAEFLNLVAKEKVERSAYHGLALTNRLLGMEVAEEVDEFVQSNRMEKWRQSIARKTLLKDVVISEYSALHTIKQKIIEDGVYRPSLCGQIGLKMACYRSLLLSQKDYKILSLPHSLRHLYYVLRPVLFLLSILGVIGRR